MKKITKILSLILAICSVICICTACTTNSHIAYTYTVDTGDSIKIELDTSDGYTMSSDLPFSIKKDDKTVLEGTFIVLDTYEQYKELVNSGDETVTIIENETEKNGLTYIFYSVADDDGSEYDYVVKINGSNYLNHC